LAAVSQRFKLLADCGKGTEVYSKYIILPKSANLILSLVRVAYEKGLKIGGRTRLLCQ